jgi:5-methylcytosine-specific restriction protein A
MELVVGRTYRRRELHESYGGQWQGGISTPADHPVIFLFAGEAGEKYGYKDDFRDDGTFWYTGEGQIGAMSFIRGNLAILNYKKNGRRLHLFRSLGKGQVLYIGEASLIGHHLDATIDREGEHRQAIIFELAVDASPQGEAVTFEAPRRSFDRLMALPLDRLREIALQAGLGVGTQESKKTVYQRSEAVKAYALKRANGVCEGCGQPAPFKNKAGYPYLEPHHIRRRADEGPDHPRWVAALCPNCHRRIHSGADGTEFNRSIGARIEQMEPEQ